jgi:lipopolysaccharide export system protein LptA
MLFIMASAHAQPSLPDIAKRKEKIHISAKNLMVDGEGKYGEFIGNVRVTQGSTLITSDRLRIFYNTDKKKKTASGEDAIEKIIAEGRVKITFDDKVAETDQAVYTTADQMLVLSGANSRVSTGNNSISGTKITLYRADGRIKVESSSDKPVEAVFYPDDSEKKGSE